MKTPRLSSRRAQRGISVITAVFLLLLFAALAALMANIISATHLSSAKDVLGSRAYQAARAGVEWGLFQVLDPSNATATSATADLPDCFASPTAIAAIPDFAVSVSCTVFPDAAVVPNYYEEGSKRIRIYRIVATATAPGPGGTIERQLAVTAEKCRDTASTAAPFGC